MHKNVNDFTKSSYKNVRKFSDLKSLIINSNYLLLNISFQKVAIASEKAIVTVCDAFFVFLIINLLILNTS